MLNRYKRKNFKSCKEKTVVDLKRTERIVKVMLSVFTFFMVLQVCGITVKAQSYKIGGCANVIAHCENHSYSATVEGVESDKVQFISVKSSNTKVLSVYLSPDKKYRSYFSCSGMSAGTATVTAKVKVNGKTVTLKQKYTVLNDKPFQYIKYEKKNIYKGNEYRSNFQNKMKNGQTFTWKLKKGYKMVSATIYNENAGTKKLKNGQKLTLPKGKETWLSFTIRTPKNQVIEYRIIMTR